MGLSYFQYLYTVIKRVEGRFLYFEILNEEKKKYYSFKISKYKIFLLIKNICAFTLVIPYYVTINLIIILL